MGILGRDSTRIVFFAGTCGSAVLDVTRGAPGVGALVYVGSATYSNYLSCSSLVIHNGRLGRGNFARCRGRPEEGSGLHILICASNAANVTGNIVLSRGKVCHSMAGKLEVAHLCSDTVSLLPCGRMCRTTNLLTRVFDRIAINVGSGVQGILGGFTRFGPRDICLIPTFVRMFCGRV